jgi:hypothetical protein
VTAVSDVVFLLVALGYEVAAFLAARMMFPHIVDGGGSDDVIDRFAAGFMSMLAGHFWPLAAPVALVLWRPRKTPKQVEAENRQMKRRIAELERELGIGGRT